MRPGLTLTELIVAMAAMLIVILALGTVIADGVRGWQRMYGRVYADVKTDGYVARNAFDRVIRQATRQTYLVAGDGAWIEVYYYSSGAAATLDRYARFYVAAGALLIKHGVWAPSAQTPRTPLRTEIVCQNVTGCVFKVDGRSAQMMLELDDGSAGAAVVSSAVMHNES